METIKSSAEITRLFNEGRRVHASNVMLIALRDEQQHGHNGRAAFIAGKKLGNAVWRNRAKRRLRAVFRDVGGIPGGYDVLVMAKKSTNTAAYENLLADAKKALGKLKG